MYVLPSNPFDLYEFLLMEKINLSKHFIHSNSYDMYFGSVPWFAHHMTQSHLPVSSVWRYYQKFKSDSGELGSCKCKPPQPADGLRS